MERNRCICIEMGAGGFGQRHTRCPAHGDRLGNHVRREGYDRCWCGCKYWENDRCIDCGGTEPMPEEIV